MDNISDVNDVRWKPQVLKPCKGNMDFGLTDKQKKLLIAVLFTRLLNPIFRI